MRTKIQSGFPRGRVARRVFVLFIGCTILPIAALAIFSYGTVTSQLKEQSRQQLRHASKALGMDIVERLLFLDAELKGFEDRTASTGTPPRRLPPGTQGEDSGRRFAAVSLLREAGAPTAFFDALEPPLQLDAAERESLASGKTVILSRFPLGKRPRLFMARAIASRPANSAVLVAEVNTTYLWGSADENSLPPRTEYCVLQAPNVVLVCTTESSPPASLLAQATPSGSASQASALQFEWTDAREKYLASAWTVFLRTAFAAPSWIVVVSQSEAEVLAPVSTFKTVFPAVILVSFGAVILFSVAQIRRSLVPLEKLQEGTRRIAERDFGSQVRVTSGDEFEALAESFNHMARRLGRQFNALTATAEVTQIILSSLNTRQIAETILLRMRDVCPCDHVGLILTGRDQERSTLFLRDGTSSGVVREETVQVRRDDIRSFRRQPKTAVRGAAELPTCLASFGLLGPASSVILPIFLKDHLAGLVALGYAESTVADAEDLAQARLLADQVALALANADLVAELSELNWGTLHALARTIDAKSPWTAGHSERVTHLALRIGQALKLGPQELDTLHRGGLLHDLGKLGVPQNILDKPERLSAEEMRTMQTHVTLGAKIIEPIAAYAAIVPMVLQHHEFFDGTGYMQGLAGEAIHFGARILAVADVVEALSAERPYRHGMEPEGVVAYVRERSGRQFDPRVVEAFLQVAAQGQTNSWFGADGDAPAGAP